MWQMPLSNFGSAPAASGRDGRSAAEANPTPRIARFILFGNMQMPLSNFGSAPRGERKPIPFNKKARLKPRFLLFYHCFVFHAVNANLKRTLKSNVADIVALV